MFMKLVGRSSSQSTKHPSVQDPQCEISSTGGRAAPVVHPGKEKRDGEKKNSFKHLWIPMIINVTLLPHISGKTTTPYCIL